MTKEERTKIYHEPQDEVLNGINSGNINNLRLVDWHKATHGYFFKDLEYILEKLSDEQVKYSVLKAAYREWEHKKDDVLAQLLKKQEHCYNDISRWAIYKVDIEAVKDFGYQCEIRIPEDAPTIEAKPATETKPFIIDKRLDSEKARNIFQKFANEGFLVINEGERYEWLKDKFALKCFVDHAIRRLNLRKTRHKKVKESWVLFQDLFYSKKFKTSRLQNYTLTYIKKYKDHEDCKVIEKIFKENSFE